MRHRGRSREYGRGLRHEGALLLVLHRCATQTPAKEAEKALRMIKGEFCRRLLGSQTLIQQFLRIPHSLPREPFSWLAVKSAAKTPLESPGRQTQRAGQPLGQIFTPPRQLRDFKGGKPLGRIGSGQQMILLHIR